MSPAPVDLAIPLHLTSCGVFTAVGSATAPAFAAMRAGIAAFKITSYRTTFGEPITAAPIPGVAAATLGRAYLEALATPALKGCIETLGGVAGVRTGLVLSVGGCVPKEEWRALLLELASTHGLGKDETRLAVVPGGEVSVVHGLAHASRLIASGRIDRCIVGGVGTLITKESLRKMELDRLLKTSRNSDGIIPGEAACFVAVERGGLPSPKAAPPALVVRGLGFAEADPSSSKRGDALAMAIRHALTKAGVAARDVAFRPSNQAGQSVVALESGIASMRVFRDPGPYPPAWLPAVSIGSVGPAVGPLLLGWAATAFQKRYAPGRVALFELVTANGPQGALVATAA